MWSAALMEMVFILKNIISVGYQNYLYATMDYHISDVCS